MLPNLDTIARQEGVDMNRFWNSVVNIDTLVGDTVNRLREVIAENSARRFPGVYIGHSGGKDSVVINWLTRMAHPDADFTVVHTPKTTGPNAVHPETVKFLYQQPFDILYVRGSTPKNYGFNVQIDGSRRDEYNRTDGRSTTIVMDGKDVSREHMTMFVKNGLFGLDFIYPIVDWSNEDVWACIHKNKLEISPEYAL